MKIKEVKREKLEKCVLLIPLIGFLDVFTLLTGLVGGQDPWASHSELHSDDGI